MTLNIPSRVRPVPIGPPAEFESRKDFSSDGSQSTTPINSSSIGFDSILRPDSAIAYDKPNTTHFHDKQITAADLEQIWAWNAELPSKDDRLVQQLIAQHVEASPDSQALEGWDGSLTYHELDVFSTAVAGALQERGIGPGVYVPLLFEKSMWTAVAFLGLIKAGGAAILLGTNQPVERLRQICEQVDAKLVLCSPETVELAEGIAGDVLVVSPDLVKDARSAARFQHPATLKPEDPVVVTFTSGSTGVPKGAIMTHANICSQFRHHRSILGYSSAMRLYDFAAHAFDVAYIDILDTLCAGGCLCVPSEDDKNNDVEGSFERLRANYTMITPTVLRTLDPARMPGLKTLIIGGESMTRADIQKWKPHLDILANTYGPAECSWTATGVRIDDDNYTPNIGRGLGQCTWVVDPDLNVLVPIGEEGELVLDGPLVGSGYVGNVAANAAFIQNPSWLLQGSANRPGRQGRLYRTGDIVRYDSTGSLWFLGRKDAQAKLRGQRIELEEVQVHVSACLEYQCPLVAEVILPQGSDRDVLVVFIQRSEALSPAESTQLKLEVAERVPSYMVPTFFIPIPTIPVTITGKTNRKQLREVGAAITIESLTSAARLAKHDVEGESFMTQPEQQLGGLWASVLNISSDLIRANDDFVELGGDSLIAIRLSQLAREQDLRLATTAILANPVLRDMALSMTSIDSQVPLMDGNIVADVSKERLEDVLATYNISMDNVDAVLPLTHMQHHLSRLMDKDKDPQGWLTWMSLDFTRPVDFGRLESACHALIEAHDILRTVIVEEGQRWLQIVLKRVDVNVRSVLTHDSIADCATRLIEQDAKPGFVLGDLCFRFWFIRDCSGTSRLMLRLPHTHFDYVGGGVMFDGITKAYDGLPVEKAGSFVDVVRSKCDNHNPAAIEYWLDLFRGSSMTEIGRPFKITDTQVGSDIVPIGTFNIPLPKLPPGVALPTLVNACWAATLASELGCDDVTFTNLSYGRTTDVENVLNVAGPCFNFLPYRARFSGPPKANDVFASISSQYLAGVAHEDVDPFGLAPEVNKWPVGTCPTSVLAILMRNPNPSFEMGGEKLELSFVARDWFQHPFSAFVSPIGDSLVLVCQRNQRYLGLELGEKLVHSWLCRLQEFSA